MVTGPRDFALNSVIRRELFNECHGLNLQTDLIVIHGDCPKWQGKTGVDAMTEDICNTYGIHTAKVPARWEVYKLRAGPIRNRLALAMFQPEKLLAFWPSKSRGGTTGCIAAAKKLGIEVKEIEDLS